MWKGAHSQAPNKNKGLQRQAGHVIDGSERHSSPEKEQRTLTTGGTLDVPERPFKSFVDVKLINFTFAQQP